MAAAIAGSKRERSFSQSGPGGIKWQRASIFPCCSITCAFVWLATSAGRFFSQSVAPLVKGLPKS